MAGEHDKLVALARATTDAEARNPLMDELAAIAPFAGGDNTVADQLATHVLEKVRAHALDTLARLIALDHST